jgi:hypothetical protein
MPQPLSRARPKAYALFDPKALTERPELAVLVARAIATWSEIEAQMGAILVRMLGAKAEPALAMFQALTSSPAQLAAMNAAAEATLSQQDKELFDAVMAAVRSSAAQRHDLAHCQWGYSEELPDALMLAESKHMMRFEREKLELARAFSEGNFLAPEPQFPRHKIHVYRKNDFTVVIERMDALRDYLYCLGFLVDRGFPWPDRIRSYLPGKPDIQAALHRIRKGSEKKPGPP